MLKSKCLITLALYTLPVVHPDASVLNDAVYAVALVFIVKNGDENGAVIDVEKILVESSSSKLTNPASPAADVQIKVVLK